MHLVLTAKEAVALLVHLEKTAVHSSNASVKDVRERLSSNIVTLLNSEKFQGWMNNQKTHENEKDEIKLDDFLEPKAGEIMMLTPEEENESTAVTYPNIRKPLRSKRRRKSQK